MNNTLGNLPWQKQQLVITAKMTEELKILQMSHQDLKQYISEQACETPLHELEEE